MKFKGKGIVWDADNNRVLCKFKNGELETDDKHVIKTLLNAGYEYEGEIDVAIEDDEFEDTPEDNNQEETKDVTKKKSSKSKGAE